MNNNSHLLPNITLGVEIRDDCGTVNTALEQCLNFLMGTLANKEQICSLADSSFRVQRSAVLGGVVGPSFSTTAIQVRMAYMLADCMYSKGLFTWVWETPDRCEVTCGGSVPHLSCKRDHIKMRDYMDRRVTPPKGVTSPTWGTPPPCKQALRKGR